MRYTISFIIVDFPEPEGPVNDTNSPQFILKLIFFNTVILLFVPTNFLVIFANLIISLLIL